MYLEVYPKKSLYCRLKCCQFSVQHLSEVFLINYSNHSIISIDVPIDEKGLVSRHHRTIPIDLVGRFRLSRMLPH